MNIFRGGVPYGPDIKRLTDTFPISNLEEGLIITHQELQAVIGLQSKSQRYYAVVDVWRHRMRGDYGINIVWQMGDGVKVLNPAEMLTFAEKRTKQKFRQTGKALQLFDYVEAARLDDTGKKRLDHMQVVRVKTSQALKESARELSIDLAPIGCLPKRRLT